MTSRRSMKWAAWFLAGAATACGGSEFNASTTDGGTGGHVSGSGGATSTGGGAGSAGIGAGGTGGNGGTAGDAGAGGVSGAGGTDGTAGAGGSGGTSCSGSVITFRMVGASGSDYCVGSCGASWVTIKTAAGATVGNLSRGCSSTCTDCAPVACPAIACVAPHHLAANGEEMTWDGNLWVSGTCGQGTGCVSSHCVSDGTMLVATMCASPGTGADASPFCTSIATEPTCVDVPFLYPTSEVVTGRLGK